MSENNGKSVAFIGLGVMGYHMAGHLAKAGHTVTVYNGRTNSVARLPRLPLGPPKVQMWFSLALVMTTTCVRSRSVRMVFSMA